MWRAFQSSVMTADILERCSRLIYFSLVPQLDICNLTWYIALGIPSMQTRRDRRNGDETRPDLHSSSLFFFLWSTGLLYRVTTVRFLLVIRESFSPDSRRRFMRVTAIDRSIHLAVVAFWFPRCRAPGIMIISHVAHWF